MKINKTTTNPFRFKLKGKTLVLIDWANVHGWEKKMGWAISLEKLQTYLRSYKNIDQVRFYFGTDTHPASKQQIKNALDAGFFVVTKPVKYLPIKNNSGIFWKRKCDFDLEIGLDCFERQNDFDCFIVFSGDGDFATLYRRLIKKHKQIIVVSASGSLGKEVAAINKDIFILKINRIKSEIAYKKNTPRSKDQGRD